MSEQVLGRFEWDSNKSESNARKHGVSFQEAVSLFDEPFLKVSSDRSGERRWLALGKSQSRIVSARMARKYEREIYKDRIGDTS
jgi:uncharacterized DUF497 family protein